MTYNLRLLTYDHNNLDYDRFAYNNDIYYLSSSWSLL